MPDAKWRKCDCTFENCTLMLCVVCGTDDCKWPGECKGKCHECGGPNARATPDNPRDPPSLTCSNECTDKAWARYEADGTAVSLSDLTPEQVNAEFNKIGLGLVGVGERMPS